MTEERFNLKLLGKVRLTIGTKLVGLIASLLTLSVFGIVWMSTRMFTEDNTDLIRQMNADTTAILATQMRELFESTTNRIKTLGTILLQDFPQPEMREKIVSEFFQDKDYLSVFVQTHSETGTTAVIQKAFSSAMAAMSDADGEKALAALAADKNFQPSQLAKGEVQLSSVKLADGSAAIVIGMPFIQTSSDHFSHSVTAFVKQSKFAKAFGEIDSLTSYMVDRYGRLLAHPDAARVAAGESVGHLEIVKELMKGQFNNNQMRYFEQSAADGKGEWRLGAFRMVGFAGIGVVAEVPELKAFDASMRVKYRSMLFSGVVLAIAFFLGFVYSGTITYPIRLLVEAAHKIAKGDFNVNLKPKSQDEIAHLSVAFNEMAKGLEERDKVKETFNKFHNKEIAEKLLSGEVKLGGERKHATIFFSDVRGFTAMSESMEPEQVVEMLNEYMTRMVAIIRAHNGIVDKYVGDAIMAIWGVPLEKPDDTLNAVNACLAMREDLAKLNELRLSRGQSVLKIGMGLNRGPVIAGNIGSVEKMEYTVIGDSVNTASRMESMTKEYGTDLLIPKAIQMEVSERFVFEKCKSARVKGKTEALEVFKVRGYVHENGQEVLITTPYSEYAAEKSDKGVHDEPAQENQAEAAVASSETHEAPAVIQAAPRVKKSQVSPPVETVTASETQVATETPTEPVAPPANGESELSIAQLIDQIPVPNPFARETAPPPAVEAAPAPEQTPTIEAAEKHVFVAEEKTDPQFELPKEAVVESGAIVDTAERAAETTVNTVIETTFEPEPTKPIEATKPSIEAVEPQTKKLISARRQWFIQAEGETFGPFALEEIRQGITSAELGAGMLAAPELTNQDWQPLENWPEFQHHFKAGNSASNAA